jgi:hypothetical protein
MKEQLEKVIENKRAKKKNLSNLRNRYAGLLYKGLVDNLSIKDIHKSIRKVTNYQIDNKLEYSLTLERAMIKTVAKAKRKTNALRLSTSSKLDMALIAYTVMQKNKVYINSKKKIYESVQTYETKAKDKILQGSKDRVSVTIKDLDPRYIDTKLKGKEINKEVIFFLASTHEDSAKDHEDYQGKIYVRSNYMSRVKDLDTLKLVGDYINKNRILTVEYVTSNPVWFITRPNCRHYFKEISTEEVLNNTTSALIDKYNMKSKIGNKQTRTTAHSVKNDWYTNTNVENIIKQYKDRYLYHNNLFLEMKNPLLENAMAKDMFLINKWQKYLNNLVGKSK